MRVSDAPGKLLLGLIMSGSRRQPNLNRLARMENFLRARGEITDWIERQFNEIESHAAWLDRTGRSVEDYCQGSAHPPSLQPGSRSSAKCTRTVTVTYGLDGPVHTKLDLIDRALLTAGWERPIRWRGPSQIGPQPWLDLEREASGSVHAEFSWKGNPDRPDALGFTTPWDRVPLSPDMSVQITRSGHQERDGTPDILTRSQRAPRNYLVLEHSAAEQARSAEESRRNHDYVLSLTIGLTYYSNPSAKARPHKIPRYQLPTKPAW